MNIFRCFCTLLKENFHKYFNISFVLLRDRLPTKTLLHVELSVSVTAVGFYTDDDSCVKM